MSEENYGRVGERMIAWGKMDIQLGNDSVAALVKWGLCTVHSENKLKRCSDTIQNKNKKNHKVHKKSIRISRFRTNNFKDKNQP